MLYISDICTEPDLLAFAKSDLVSIEEGGKPVASLPITLDTPSSKVIEVVYDQEEGPIMTLSLVLEGANAVKVVPVDDAGSELTDEVT